MSTESVDTSFADADSINTCFLDQIKQALHLLSSLLAETGSIITLF